jgi:hypothetical protein
MSDYPTFFNLYALGGDRFALVSTSIHRGSVFGCLEGNALHLYGARNFSENGGRAWGKNYSEHEHLSTGDCGEVAG